MFAISLLIGFRVHSGWAVLAAYVYMALIGITFTALGTAIASILSDFQGFQLVMNFLVMPIFFLSGALFPLSNVPRVLGAVAAADPLSYGVDGLRSALTGTAFFGPAVDFAVLAALSVALLALGSYCFSRIEL